MKINQENSHLRINTVRAAGVPPSTMAALVLAVFTVSVGFGVVLPFLPYLIERLLGTGVEAAQISRHTGLMTSFYTLSLFLFAPYGDDYPIDVAHASMYWVRNPTLLRKQTT